MSELKRYDVSGRDLGDGKPAPAGTVLKLRDDDAVRLGLIDPPRKADDGDGEPKAKPRKAPGQKRPAPRKRAASK